MENTYINKLKHIWILGLNYDGPLQQGCVFKQALDVSAVECEKKKNTQAAQPEKEPANSLLEEHPFFSGTRHIV